MKAQKGSFKMFFPFQITLLPYADITQGDARLVKKTCPILTLAVVVLAACTSTSAPPTVDTVPTPAATAAITAEPTSAPPAGDNTSTPAPDAACPAAKDGFNLHVAAEDGYCLFYPAEAVVVPKRFIVINPASATADTHGDAWVDIQVESASGRSAAQVADAKIAEAGEGFGIERSEILLGGQQAIVVDGLPAPDSWRTVFVVDDDRLYTLTFQPWFPSGDPDQPTPLETLYTTIVDTLRFTP
jgi:hypothetical protein